MFQNKEFTIKILACDELLKCEKRRCPNKGEFALIIESDTDKCEVLRQNVCPAHILTEIIDFWTGVY